MYVCKAEVRLRTEGLNFDYDAHLIKIRDVLATIIAVERPCHVYSQYSTVN